MTHLLHTYIAGHLSNLLGDHRIVVWYDPRGEFAPFIEEVAGADATDSPQAIELAEKPAHLVTHDGSLYSARARVEPLTGDDEPPHVLIYLAGVARDPDGSVLMELELAGRRWEPQLKQLARVALRQRFTDGVVDELLHRQNVTYRDLVAAAGTEGASAPSVLRTLLKGHAPGDQIASWLATPALDQQIESKEAHDELRKLVQRHLALSLEGNDLAKWRSMTSRFTLAVEFRSDLQASPPRELDGIPATTDDIEGNARGVAQALREAHATEYRELADRAAQELGLKHGVVDALALGAIDTFRFEEMALLQQCGELVHAGEYERVCDIAAARSSSFWLQESIERQAQWQAVRLAAELGAAADEVEQALAKAPASTSEWVASYATSWHRLDRAQRHLEAWLPKLDDDPDERALVAVRRRYDEVLDRLTHGFVDVLEASGWSVEDHLQQTSVYDDVVASTPGRVAYFLVDALRYEMGVELAERLEPYAAVTIRPAVGVLPSITKMAMAALMPGAAASYDVIESESKLVARVGDTKLADRASRTSRVKALVPSSADLELDEVQALPKARLEAKIGGAKLVVVRSTEIDSAGEGGYQARPIMDTVIEKLARAVRKLASLGIEQAVIAADHGYLHAAADREEAMRIDAPGGGQVELHRRCWIGRGGATPAGSIRVAARALGNDTDLDFVFPRGIGVFKAGGGLAYHHGGPSLQELVIPVISVRSSVASEAPGATPPSLSVSDVPAIITNRIFSVKVAVTSLLGADLPIKPLLMSDQGQVGHVGLAIGGKHDRASDTVTIDSAGEVTIGFVLDDDHATSVRVVIVDPATEAQLYLSPTDIPVQLGVR